MAKQLTQARLKELLHYNPETGVFTRIAPVTGGPRVGDIAGSTNSQGYRTVRLDGGVHLLNRLAWLYIFGVTPKRRIFVKNLDRQDSRISNLFINEPKPKDGLTAERLRELFSYDPETGSFVRCGLQLNNRKPSARTSQSSDYLSAFVDGNSYLVHRLIWLYVYGEMPRGFIDHRDRNRRNNKLNNLRLCTSSADNPQNSVRKPGASGFRGCAQKQQYEKPIFCMYNDWRCHKVPRVIL